MSRGWLKSGLLVYLLFSWLTFLLTATNSLAAPQLQPPPEGEVYVIQAEDRLSKIAEKYYDDTTLYPLIVQATNAKAAEDNTFTPITDPDVIEIGQKLWIPPRDRLPTSAVADQNIDTLPEIAEIGTAGDTLAFSLMLLRNGFKQNLVEEFLTGIIPVTFERRENSRASADLSGFILDFVGLMPEFAFGQALQEMGQNRALLIDPTRDTIEQSVPDTTPALTKT